MRKIIRLTILVSNIFAALGLVAIYLAQYINPLYQWLPSLWALSYPYFLFVNVCFILFWAFLHWQYLFLSLLSILLGLQVLNNHIQLFPRKTDKQGGLKVLSYNVQHYYSYLDNRDADESLLDFIAKQKADIICLQETKLQKEGMLNPVKLKTRFPGIAHCQLAHMSKWGGPVTFSRFPIVNMGELRFDGTNNMAMFADIKKGEDTIRVYNCHLQSFRFRWSDYSIMDSLSLDSKQWNELRHIGYKLKIGNKRRAEQIKQLVAHIEKSPYSKIIVCGDFNDTPSSYTYRKIRKLLSDSFVESGSGTSTTYRERITLYRIDYIFHSKEFNAYNYTRYKVPYSDHYPISTVLMEK